MIKFQNVGRGSIGALCGVGLLSTPGISSDAATLQAKIALLEAQNKTLQQRLDAIEARMAQAATAGPADGPPTPRVQTQQVPQPALAAESPETAGMVQASAPSSGGSIPWLSKITQDGSKLTLSGQVNRAIWFGDNGRRSGVHHLDNNESSTRLTFAAEKPWGGHVHVGAVIEGELGGNNTSNTDIGQQPTTTTLAARKLEFWTRTKWGELWLGQGETAANRVTDVDLSGTTVISEGAEFEAMAGGLKFVRGSFGETASASDRDRSLGDTYTEVLGSSRKNRVRYITPSFAGWTMSIAHSTRDYSDVSLRYDGKIKDVAVAGALGYAHNPFNGKAQTATKFGRQDYGGSFSVLLPVGISLGGAGALRHFDDPFRQDGTMWASRVGYQKRFFDFGQTALSTAYGEGRALFDSTPNVAPTNATFAEDNSEKVRIAGIYLVQNIDSIWTEFYLGYQTHRLRRKRVDTTTGVPILPGYHFKDSQVIMAGGRVRF